MTQVSIPAAQNTYPLPQALTRLQDQPQVQNLLARALHEHKLGHAYLFVGAPGSGKGLAAKALAQCVLCTQGGDAACDDCIRISRGTHPDVHVLTPASANGYLIEQIRQLIADVSLAPMRSTHKIYVIDRADLLRENSANALLKTIEEPPADTIFILSARSSFAEVSTSHESFLSRLPKTSISCLRIFLRVADCKNSTALPGVPVAASAIRASCSVAEISRIMAALAAASVSVLNATT